MKLSVLALIARDRSHWVLRADLSTTSQKASSVVRISINGGVLGVAHMPHHALLIVARRPLESAVVGPVQDLPVVPDLRPADKK